jgi:hypothetical protein
MGLPFIPCNFPRLLSDLFTSYDLKEMEVVDGDATDYSKELVGQFDIDTELGQLNL